MKTLFPDNFRWSYYFLALLIIRIIFFNISWFSFLAVAITIQQFVLLFDGVGKILPTRYLFGSLMCLQFFLGPVLAYNGLDEYQYFMYKMRLVEADYFIYAIPAVISFIIGLHIKAGNNSGELVDQKRLQQYVKQHKSLSYILIIIGLFSSVLSNFFSSEFAFVFYLIGGFKFVGLFLLLLGERTIKVLPLVLVLGSIITTSLGSGMFHDLLTWIVYLSSILAIKYKFSNVVKISGITAFTIIVIIIQVLKSNYRTENVRKKEESDIERLSKVYQKENEQTGVFSFGNLAEASVRINQGFIVTNIMYTVPEREPHANGSELYMLLESAFLPRFLAPNKLNAGDRTIFTKYSGMPLTEGTSMGLSSIGDAYINFGKIGGSIFMFILGMFYSWVLGLFQKNSYNYPILILFSTLVFYYPIRPDCETQTILGHLVKASFLVIFILQFWRTTFYISSSRS
jgi:hypothetical protein